MLLTLLSWVVGLICVAICGARFARVRARASEAEKLLANARRAPKSGQAEESSVTARWVQSLAKVPEGPERIAALNEELAEISRELDVGAGLPASAARIALSAGTLLAVIELARTLPGGEPAVRWAVTAFAGGAVAALLAGQLGRSAERQAERTRAAWNELARRLGRAPDDG